MAQDYPGRRDLFRWAAGSAAALSLSSRALAQKGDPLDVLDGLKLPPELQALLPTKPLNLARTIAALLKLESDADAARLPFSPLAFNSGGTLPSSEDRLYAAAMPRLVTLVDRSDGLDVGVGDRAGAILADLNATQRIIPDGLQPDKIDLSRGHDFETLKAEYAAQFAAAAVRPEHAEFAGWNLKVVEKFRDRYESVGKATGVPWYFIGAIHGLESSFNFRAHLHNGDFPLSARTRQVPSGRPTVWLPPSDWESSAKDALRVLGFAGKSDWTLERTLYRLEAYNGFGYRKRGVATPYLWCLSNQYERGKFVADGSWNPNARSQQCGAAVMLKMLVDAKAIELPGMDALPPAP